TTAGSSAASGSAPTAAEPASALSATAALSAATTGIAGAAAARGTPGARLARGAAVLVATERATALARVRTRPRSTGTPRRLLRGACTAGLPAVEAARNIAVRAVACRHPIPAAVLRRGSLIPVAHAGAVLGIVLPALPAALASVPASVDVPFLVLIDVDVLIPAATAAAVVVVDVVFAPVAVAAPHRTTDGHPGTEREQARGRDVFRRIAHHRGVGWRRGRAVHRGRAVLRDVDDLWIRGLDPDDLLLLHDLPDADLLLSRLP